MSIKLRAQLLERKAAMDLPEPYEPYVPHGFQEENRLIVSSNYGSDQFQTLDFGNRQAHANPFASIAPVFGEVPLKTLDTEVTFHPSLMDPPVSTVSAGSFSLFKLSSSDHHQLGMHICSVSSINFQPHTFLRARIQDNQDQVQELISSIPIMEQVPTEQPNVDRHKPDRSGQPTEFDWFRYRRLIERMYRSHNLDYVRNDMEQRHGFRARYSTYIIFITQETHDL